MAKGKSVNECYHTPSYREVFLVLRMPDTDEGAQRRSKLANARAPAKRLAMGRYPENSRQSGMTIAIKHFAATQIGSAQE
jgi:hypothetical protein